MIDIADPEKFRENIRVKLNAVIQNEEFAENLEKGILNYTINEATINKVIKKWKNSGFVTIYINRLRSVYINLKNPDIINRVNSGEITPEWLSQSNHQEFSPEKWRTMIELKIKKDASKYVNKIRASTDIFKCRKCKGRNCSFYEVQLRSCDEPMTIFISCLDCGATWRQ
jgi:transcription elongation factor S-II